MHTCAAAAPAALLAIVALAAGCGAGGDTAPGSITVTDGTGRSVTLAVPATRIVSMVPALTDWIVAMGAADRLVARTDYDRDPGLALLPSVGGGLDPSVEWLAALRPDLVLAWPDTPNRSLVSRLQGLGFPTYTAPTQTIEDALTAAADLGRMLGDDPAAGDAVRRVRQGLDKVARSVAPRPRPTVLFLIGLDPLMAAGPGTFVDQLLEYAGGRNTLADLQILWPNLSLEEVVRRAPDVIIIGSAGLRDPASLGSRPGWRNLPAVRQGRVHVVDPEMVNRPGPRLHEAAAHLARLIHPDVP
jgi:iron complex transport system substrate-binding protein